METIKINGVDYVRADSVQGLAEGSRKVLVLDRGWILADIAGEDGDTLTLARVVCVRSWRGCGFDGVLSDPLQEAVTLEVYPVPVQVPATSVVFAVPVNDQWGLT